MVDDKEPKTETEGSSLATGLATGAGAVLGATALVALAPVVLPIVGLGALAGAATPLVGGLLGGWAGYKWGGKK
jgi:hypothetical protein